MTVEPLDAELARVHMTVPRRLLEKLEAARDALSHSHPGASRDEIIEAGLDLLLASAAKRRGLVEKSRSAGPTSRARSTDVGAPAKPRSRYVPADVRRAVWKRDDGKCQWPIDGGGICAATYQVEIDHIDGFALGGGTTTEECRLLCRVHQDVSARRLYGDDLMNKYTRPKGETCSEPVAVYRAHIGASARARLCRTAHSPRIGQPCGTTSIAIPGCRPRSIAAYSSARSRFRLPQAGGSMRSSGARSGEVQAGSPCTVTWKTRAGIDR
jgi:hypothetical protein